MVAPEWLTRALLALIMATHGYGKVVATDAFMDKFDLSLTVSLLAATAELAGAAGVLLGGFAEHPWFRPSIRWAGVAASLLGVVCILVVQVGALFMVHLGSGWYYFTYGSEYNVVLVGIAIAIAMWSLGTARSLRTLQ